MSRLSFANDFELDLPLVANSYVLNAAGFTENSVVSLNSLSYQMLNASAGSFLFHNAGNQNFTLKLRLLSSRDCSHNHCGKRPLRVHSASRVNFAFFNPKRQMAGYCIHMPA